jgi:two-component system phosphate regulon sensor histidine kinase PhoR
MGIPAHLQSRVTDRFFRILSHREEGPAGFGLGLAIVRQILDRHGAKLEVESTPGEGSLFTCCFPAERVIREVLEDGKLLPEAPEHHLLPTDDVQADP